MSVGDGSTAPVKPSQIGDCPECHHQHPHYRTCPGGLYACGGNREHCPRCPQPVPVETDAVVARQPDEDQPPVV